MRLPIPALPGVPQAILRGDSSSVRALLLAFGKSGVPPASLRLVVQSFPALCATFPVLFLDLIKNTELQDEFEIFNGADMSNLAPLRSMIVAGSNTRSPFGFWNAIIEYYSCVAANHSDVTKEYSQRRRGARVNSSQLGEGDNTRRSGKSRRCSARVRHLSHELVGSPLRRLQGGQRRLGRSVPRSAGQEMPAPAAASHPKVQQAAPPPLILRAC